MSAKVRHNSVTHTLEGIMSNLRIDQAHVEVGIINQQVCADVLREKYLQNGEKVLGDISRRVAKGLFPAGYQNPEYQALVKAIDLGLFFPAGRVFAGAGTKNHVTLHNCYVIGTIDDSMKGIHMALGEAAVTLQMGGGVGQDFSSLRPEGAKLKRTGEGSRASGPLPFMEEWNAMSNTVMSIGHRRGAMMATMRDSHPDIYKFITAKHKKGVLTNFNVSVLVSDAFIAAVEEDADWELYHEKEPVNPPVSTFVDDKGVRQYVYKVVKARSLWDTILQSTHKYSEPGVIFIDRVNELNNLKHAEDIRCTNPCGEQPLPPYGACDLGSVNLARMVCNPFTKDAVLDLMALEAATRIGVRTLDAVIDASLYPLEEYKAEQVHKRRIGLGIVGLADALAMMQLTYGSAQAESWTDMAMQTIANAAYQESAVMAKEKGIAPVWKGISRKKMLELPFIQKLSLPTRGLIKKYGLRNGVLLSIAPTGTMSTAFGYVSSGCEPVFSHVGKRKVIMPGSTEPVVYETYGYGYKMYQYVHGPTQVADLPTYMVTAQKLSVDDHVVMQAVCQKWIDASVSKTVNCPKDISFEQFKRVYEQAYLKGCKGCTTYTPSDIRGSVLEDGDTATASSSSSDNTLAPLKGIRPQSLNGKTYQLKWPGYESSIYITINENQGRITEIFCNTSSAKNFDWITSTMRAWSALLRHGADPQWLIDDALKIASFNDFKWEDGKLWPSLVARIAGVLHEHITGKSGNISPQNLQAGDSGRTKEQPQHPANVDGVYDACPKCDARAFVHKEGCGTCASCGFSNCG